MHPLERLLRLARLRKRGNNPVPIRTPAPADPLPAGEVNDEVRAHIEENDRQGMAADWEAIFDFESGRISALRK
jgi:hypothetical protein